MIVATTGYGSLGPGIETIWIWEIADYTSHGFSIRHRRRGETRGCFPAWSRLKDETNECITEIRKEHETQPDMETVVESSLFQRLNRCREDLTPKAKVLCDYILQHPRQAVFQRVRELARSCGVSEATVVRFVEQLGYDGYKDFIQALKDHVDTELTLVDRVQLAKMDGPETERLGRVILEEIRNLKSLYESLDVETIRRTVDLLREARTIYVVGSRLSYTFAYYFGWSLTKLRTGVTILKGSDSTAIDRLTLCPESALVVMVATTRYPNELIRLAKVVRRNHHTLLLITDSPLCPLSQFAQLTLIAPCEHFPIVGSPSTISCLINCLIVEMIHRNGDDLRRHQEKLEKAFLENDILFNLEKR